MIIGVLKETAHGETRVAVVPQVVTPLKKEGHDVLVQAGAGQAAGFPDEAYTQAGARIATDAAAVTREAAMIVKVQPPGIRGDVNEAALMKPGSTYVGFLAPLANPGVVGEFTQRKITSFAMEYIPRITRAQSMDALSSMATIAGYKAVLTAADRLGQMFPLLMTAAGTIPPANVLILGAGVAGLQAIATARRLGARVEAFDPRPAVKEQVKSLGAGFLEMEVTENAEAAGGYAKQMSDEFLKKEQEAIATRLAKVDVVISTAQVFGKRAPVLITAAMVKLMKPGSVIVDLAAEQGGNCEETRAGETILVNGVTIVGAVNLPALVPHDASMMYSRNLLSLIQTLYPKGAAAPNFEDEIATGACITRDGAIANASVRDALSRTSG
ncbi:MAG: transhydrogenase alpha subunit [Bacteroidetes bacterium]|nr:transhydrogenase alpha subunit [Bacteroidota bacterium]